MGDGDFSKLAVDERRVLGYGEDGARDLDGKVVVLRGDLDFSCPQIYHRLIGPMVTELQLVRLQSQCQPENLMPQTNAEDRTATDKLPHRIHGVRHCLRITRPVGEKDTVWVQSFVPFSG